MAEINIEKITLTHLTLTEIEKEELIKILLKAPAIIEGRKVDFKVVCDILDVLNPVKCVSG